MVKFYDMTITGAKASHVVALVCSLIAIIIIALPHEIKMYPSKTAQASGGDLAGITQVEFLFKLGDKVKIKPTGTTAPADLSYSSMYSGGTASVHSMYFPKENANGFHWLDTACKKEHEVNGALRPKLFRHGFSSWRLGMLIVSVVAAIGSALLIGWHGSEKYHPALAVAVVIIGIAVVIVGAVALDDGLDATRCFWDSYGNQTNWETVGLTVGGGKPDKPFKQLKQMFRAEYAFTLIYGIFWILSGVFGSMD